MGEELWLQTLLNSALNGGEWLDSGRGRFVHKGSDQETQLIERLRGTTI